MHTRNVTIGSQTISFETGKLAKQADGSVIVRLGDTMVLVTACYAANPREGIDFLPLTVDYREYTYASGRIPGGFFKREGKPSEKEVLTSRMTDRPIRPLFPNGWRHETQVIALVLSADTENDSDVLAITGASAALAISEIPFQKTIASVRVGLVDGAVRHQSDLPAAAPEPPRPDRRGQPRRHRDGRGRREGSDRRGSRRGARARRTPPSGRSSTSSTISPRKSARRSARSRRRKSSREFYREVEEKVLVPLSEAMRIRGKLENYDRVDEVLDELIASLPEGEVQRKVEAKSIFKELKEKVLRDEVLEHGVRLDGRKFDEIRAIWSEVGVLPRVHGSAVFTRGETQALVTATLGTADDQQKVETVDGDGYKRFMLHYNFPPFSVGEVAFLRGPGRREVGHGALAERALTPVVPAEEKFPYTIRVVSDILESNGSSSMASVCGGTMAMMDAGVPLAAPVAGIAMGLIMDEQTGKHAVLSDIAGAEDHYGDMDFKVAGTAKGITALQMDIKVGGITADVMREALHQARAGRLYILGKMAETLADAARQHLDLRAAHHHHQDSGRQDPRRHRAGRQDDPQHHRAHRREDRRRGRWPRERGVGRRGVGTQGHRHDPGADRDAGAEQDLPRQGAAHHRLRRLRRDHAGHRRSAARLGDREPPREGRARRAEGRRAAAGEGDQHRPDRQDSAEPQGAAERSRARSRPREPAGKPTA